VFGPHYDFGVTVRRRTRKLGSSREAHTATSWSGSGRSKHHVEILVGAGIIAYEQCVRLLLLNDHYIAGSDSSVSTGILVLRHRMATKCYARVYLIVGGAQVVLKQETSIGRIVEPLAVEGRGFVDSGQTDDMGLAVHVQDRCLITGGATRLACACEPQNNEESQSQS
jgi:hypothetical protein